MVNAQQIPLVSSARADLNRRRSASPVPELWQALDSVCDPELAVVSLWDLGVLQDVRIEGARVVVVLTPTYSGCPALDVMQEDVEDCIGKLGMTVAVKLQLAPAWSSDWLTIEAKVALAEFGIAPPAPAGTKASPFVACPQCGSTDTNLVSEFSSTSCKALYRCRACQEPFDYFKAL